MVIYIFANNYLTINVLEMKNTKLKKISRFCENADIKQIKFLILLE